MPRAPKACGHRGCEDRVVGCTYCPTHQAQYQTRPNTKQRGYGSTHQAASIKARTEMAEGTPCNRCGHPMYHAQALALDHDDHDRTKYRGLAHKTCNDRAASANTGWARAKNPRPPTPPPPPTP